MKRKKIILGIHGIGNKPPAKILKKWWRKSIEEGLQRIGYPRRFFKFELVYWADILYSKPLNPRIKNQEHPQYVKNPYVATSKYTTAESKRDRIKKLFLNFIERLMDSIFFTFDRFIKKDLFTDLIIKRKFKDLGKYFQSEAQSYMDTGIAVKKTIQRRLANSLRKHRKKDILLIAHSMGSIIAYDVLMHVVPDIKIHTFVTMGSPLGLPSVLKKILADQSKEFLSVKKAKTPDNITHHWYNLSDLRDRIALNYNLADDFSENKYGVKPEDLTVKNDYVFMGKKNPHKSFGYLRTPEMAEIIHEFLTEPYPGFLTRIKKMLKVSFADKLTN